MSQTVFALIYCASLSSRSTGTCTSSRSAINIIIDCIRDHPVNASKIVSHSDVPSTHLLLRSLRAACLGQERLLFTSKHARRKNFTKPLQTARSQLKSQPLLSKSALLRPAYSRVLASRCPIFGTHTCGIRANHSPAANETRYSSDQNHSLQPFLACIASLSLPSGDIKEAWTAFEDLRTFENLPMVPDNEFLEFIPHAYKASLLSIDLPGTLSKESASHLGHLHDEVLRRVEISIGPESSRFRTWLTPLALQTLLLAGKIEKATQRLSEAFVAGEKVGTQQLGLLRQLFIAAILQENLEAGMSVLVKAWPWIKTYFCWYRSDQESDEEGDELRRSVLFAFKEIADGEGLLKVIGDKAAQEVGVSILAFQLCTNESSDRIHAVHREFVSSGLPVSLDTHAQFFESLLAGHAYARAYDVRKHIYSLSPGDRHVKALLSRLTVPDDIHDDVLSWKAQETTMDRFSSCIKDDSIPRSDLRSIWDDVEASDCLRRRLPNGCLVIRDYDMRVFAKAVIDNSCAKFGNLAIPNADEAVYLLDKICAALKRRYQRKPDEETSRTKMQPLVWHSMILKGDLLPVRNMLVKERKGHLPDRARTITQLFLASIRLQSLPEAFDHIVALWPMMVRHVDDAAGRYTAQEMKAQSENLREAVFGVFGEIENPAGWIAASLTTMQAQETAGHLFCVMFRERREPDKALRLFNGLLARKLPLSFHAHLVLMKLFLPRRYDVANRIHRSLREHFPEKTTDLEQRHKDELHVGLRLFALQGNVNRAQEYFNIMGERGFVDGGAQLRLLHAYAVNGDTERVRELFSKFFTAKTRYAEDYFRTTIYAHVRAGDVKGINYWLEEMIKSKIRPNLSIYNTILLAFATSLDLDSAIAVLQRMRENGIQPDHVSYSTVMSIMAQNKDPVGAERLYRRALEEGVVPDDIMIRTLMNAHVEAGSWKGVIRAFDYLLQSSPRGLTVELCNTLLKAYVLIGAPFETVFEIFRRYQDLRLEPNEYTYALLIQSACDAGQMKFASDIFVRLVNLETEEGGASHINVYTMTIIMAGFLRIGDRQRARMVYDDMCARGIQPTSVTFGIIINSYANERSEESLRIADEFLRGLLDTDATQRAWMGSARGGRGRALDAVFGPLLSIYGSRLDVAAVEKYYDQMLAAGGEPGLINLTLLMDAYRRVNNIESVQQLWGEIVQLARNITENDPFLQLVSPGGAPGARSLRQTNMLCLPLSVYIKALSAAGQHLAIARTWRQVKEWGFSFDAHNWNHLAAALVRAGEVERAFEVVELVVLPFQRQTLTFVRARAAPATPLTFLGERGLGAGGGGGGDGGDEEEGESLPHRDPRQPSRRSDAVQSAAEHRAELSPLGDDLAQQLHELQQLSVTWQAWHPHEATLDALSGALERLQAGLLVRPAGQALPRAKDPRRVGEREALELRELEREAAAAMTRRICERFPETVEMVQQRRSAVASAWERETEETRVYS